jgi:hypothetical protein
MSNAELLSTIYYLFFGLFTVHFLADFPFQTPYMLRKNDSRKWFLPLVSHALSHGILSFFVVARYGLDLGMQFGGINAFLHLMIDFFTGQMLPDIEQERKTFWVKLGFDQWLHYLSYLYMISMVIDTLSKATH